MSNDQDTPLKLRPIGRPNLVDRASIIDTALLIGLENVTMKAVAERLGVSIGALYRHVRSRDELLALIADKQLRRMKLPKDLGQPWAELARSYAASLFETFHGQPALFGEYASGSFPLLSEVDGIEGFLGAMERRGFAVSDALALLQNIRSAALGSALVATAYGAIGAHEGASFPVDDTLAARGADEIPHLRSVVDQYRQLVTYPSWEETIDRILEAFGPSRSHSKEDGHEEF